MAHANLYSPMNSANLTLGHLLIMPSWASSSYRDSIVLSGVRSFSFLPFFPFLPFFYKDANRSVYIRCTPIWTLKFCEPTPFFPFFPFFPLPFFPLPLSFSTAWSGIQQQGELIANVPQCKLKMPFYMYLEYNYRRNLTQWDFIKISTCTCTPHM